MSEMDRELASELVKHIMASADLILSRFRSISNANDFLNSDAGLEKLDAICMQLIALGESVKQLDKVTQRKFLPAYPQVEWKRVMGMRDILSHHYFDVDAETVYFVCKHHIPVLKKTATAMLKDLEQDG